MTFASPYRCHPEGIIMSDNGNGWKLLIDSNSRQLPLKTRWNLKVNTEATQYMYTVIYHAVQTSYSYHFQLLMRALSSFILSQFHQFELYSVNYNPSLKSWDTLQFCQHKVLSTVHFPLTTPNTMLMLINPK